MPTPSIVDWSDSFYKYVEGRILAINPTRKFGGIVQARAWPLKTITFESFYLLIGDIDPIAGEPFSNSWSAPLLAEKVQWIWQIQGDVPVSLTASAANNGDRYRTHFAMIQELLTGMYPGFCQIYSWAVGYNENNQPSVVSTPYSPVEFIKYGKPYLRDNYDASKGILTGGALTTICNYAPTITG